MKRTRLTEQRVVFYQYPPFVYTWLLILLGFVMYPLAPKQKVNPGIIAATNPAPVAEAPAPSAKPMVDPEVLAWIYGVVLMVTLITMGINLHRNYTIFALVVLIAFALAARLLRDRNIMVLAHVHDFFKQLDPTYSPTFGILVSIVLGAVFVGMFIWSRIDSRWVVTHNLFEHQKIGRVEDSLARGAKRITVSYPDVFEFALCLSGTLHVWDPNGQRELRRLEHVPFLPFISRKINKLWSTTAVTADIVDDEHTAEGLGGMQNAEDREHTL